MPTGLIANQTKLAWDWNEAGGAPADGFRILYGPAAGDRSNTFSIAVPSARDVLIADVLTVSAPVTLFFVVVAFNANGTSPESNEISVLVEPPLPVLPVAPTNLRTVAV